MGPVYRPGKGASWPPGLCCRLQEADLQPRTLTADDEEVMTQSDLGVNVHLSVRIFGIIYVPVTI